MEFEVLPREVPVMTLPGAVLFPHVLMPLYIFEPRYRKMLADVLEQGRLFAVAGLDEGIRRESDQEEPLYSTAAVGVVRACQKNDDGTAHLVLQGVCRVDVVRIVREDPYRVIEVRPRQSEPGAAIDELVGLRRRLGFMLDSKRRSGGEIPDETLEFLSTIDDPEAYIDIAAYALCSDPQVKQRLLETLNTGDRYEIFMETLRGEISNLRLDQKLRGELDDGNISLN